MLSWIIFGKTARPDFKISFMDESRQLEEILNTLVNKNDEEEEQISVKRLLKGIKACNKFFI